MDRKLPWADLETVRIRMISGDVWAFGPTILEAGKEYVLPIVTAGQFLARGTAELVAEPGGGG